jgi:uncharacterized RDD family membrane protein YckC
MPLEDVSLTRIADQQGDRITVDTPELITLELPLAGIGSRFLAMTLDTVIQVLLYTAGIFAVVGISKYASFLPLSLAWLPKSWLPALLVLFLFSVYWGYFAAFELFWKGKTPGKRAAGIRAVKDSGRALNVYEVIGRNLMRAVDWLPGVYGAGIVTMMISSRNQRLGDLLVGSIVVHDKTAEAIKPSWSQSSEKTFGDLELAKITPEELVLIETYLQRRDSFDLAVRDATAYRIATRITAKTGIKKSAEQSLDDFLETIAKQTRDTARLR